MNEPIGLHVNLKDNVATIFANDIKKGINIKIVSKNGDSQIITALDDIPYGHKIALSDINKGEVIIKYGETIGLASKDISLGMYVHVHNLDSCRGRGDLDNKGV